MKKTLTALFAFCCIVIACSYIFMPGRIQFSKVIHIKVNQSNASKLLTDEDTWNKWWYKQDERKEQTGTQENKSYTYKKDYFIICNKMLQADSIIIKNNSSQVNTLINIIPLESDSVVMQWKGQSANTNNPFKRFKNYLVSNKIEKNIDELLQSMKVFLENTENVYGLRVEEVKVKDTLLVATKYFSGTYPTTNEIYKLIQDLKDFISKEGRTETNYPMLHIDGDSSGFRTMVAIPVDKLITIRDNFLFRRMVPGKILVAEVKGGVHTTATALKQLEVYLKDNQLHSPAIPFESLVTDRSKETDTTKWITRIYYPIY